jgi:hypothetical protein
VVFCNQCGTKNPEDAAYCGNCGAPGTSPVYQPFAPAAVVLERPLLRRSPLKTILWIASAVVVVCTLIVTLGVRQGVEKVVDETARAGIKQHEQTDNARTDNIRAAENIRAIQAVIRQDQELSDAMNAVINQTKIKSEDDFDTIAALMRNYVQSARKIDTSSCPRDFAEAYYRHLSAWSEEATAVRAHPHIPTGDESFVEGFYRGLAGDPTGGAGELRDELKAWGREVTSRDAEVHRSWEEVEALAVRYGA